MQALQANNIQIADMSHYQGDAQFTSFASYGVHGAIFKATQGVGYVDPNYATFTVRARAENLPFTAYHFAEPKNNHPNEEASHFAKQWIGAGVPAEIAWLDLEANCEGMTADQVADWVLAFETCFKSTTGKELGLYSDVGFIQQFNGFNGRLSHMKLWIADYPGKGADLANVVIPDMGGWPDWVMWQYTDAGSIAGVPNAVDLNYARSLEAIGLVAPLASKPTTALVDSKVANAVIDRWVGHDYDKASSDDQLFRAYVADVLRVVSGQAPHNATLLGTWKPQL